LKDMCQWCDNCAGVGTLKYSGMNYGYLIKGSGTQSCSWLWGIGGFGALGHKWHSYSRKNPEVQPGAQGVLSLDPRYPMNHIWNCYPKVIIPRELASSDSDDAPSGENIIEDTIQV
jgi:hypothetical protein